MPFIGKCLCGQTTVSVDSAHPDQVICHCLDCRATSGTAFTTNILVPEKYLKVEGPTKEFAARGDSGNMVRRVFCSVCGCAISHKSAVFGDSRAVQTGLFPTFAKIPVGAEIYTKDRWSVIPAIKDAGQFEKTPPS